jgi:cytochrome c oxidase assembly protein subunit 15
MRRLRTWALAATIATYLLIFVGGLVRVSGAGLGCPDWPKCYGRWIPPTSLAQLPPNVDPSSFNLMLAWIEYVNRLVGVVIGLFILTTAILAWRYARHIRRILYPALVALILVALEGWQGGAVVGTKLAALVVTVHMVLAFLIASILIYLTLQVHWEVIGPTASRESRSQTLTRWLWPLWIVAVISVALGTQVRSGIEALIAQFPSESIATLMNSVGWVKLAHPLVGSALLVATWWVGLRLLWKANVAAPLARGAAWALMILSVLQMTLGLTLVGVGLPAALRVLHLWLSSFYVGALVVLHVTLHSQPGEKND